MELARALALRCVPLRPGGLGTGLRPSCKRD
jgi:hypothetical protein